ncbi:hypothetical protein [uncultured Nocardioides sp.]|uniref:hypothetical protein n=1 Tax=uncultured Nocardioides sp. TaxID=198441 RepID=UPI002612BECA|nr:hypothetical protein [uncultured Nocardioides sp.]
MSIPLQCAGAKKIRCPHMACAFSEDPGVLGEANDPSGALRRQFVGDHPARLVSIPLALVGPLLFVYVGFASPASPDDLRTKVTRCLRGADRTSTVTERLLETSWQAGPARVAAALAARHGRDRAEVASRGGRRSEPDGGGIDQVDGLVVANLVLGRLDGVTVAALFRPLGPQRCSVLSAALLSDSDQSRFDADVWRELVGACEVA